MEKELITDQLNFHFERFNQCLFGQGINIKTISEQSIRCYPNSYGCNKLPSNIKIQELRTYLRNNELVSFVFGFCNDEIIIVVVKLMYDFGQDLSEPFLVKTPEQVWLSEPMTIMEFRLLMNEFLDCRVVGQSTQYEQIMCDIERLFFDTHGREIIAGVIDRVVNSGTSTVFDLETELIITQQSVDSMFLKRNSMQKEIDNIIENDICTKKLKLFNEQFEMIKKQISSLEFAQKSMEQQIKKHIGLEKLDQALSDGKNKIKELEKKLMDAKKQV